MVSGYLLRRRRTLAEAMADIERAKAKWTQPMKLEEPAAVAGAGIDMGGHTPSGALSDVDGKDDGVSGR